MEEHVATLLGISIFISLVVFGFVAWHYIDMLKPPESDRQRYCDTLTDQINVFTHSDTSPSIPSDLLAKYSSACKQ